MCFSTSLVIGAIELIMANGLLPFVMMTRFTNFALFVVLEFYYTATTYTADGANAGTAAKIYLKLVGVYGQTNEIQLVGSDDNVFKAGE